MSAKYQDFNAEGPLLIPDKSIKDRLFDILDKVVSCFSKQESGRLYLMLKNNTGYISLEYIYDTEFSGLYFRDILASSNPCSAEHYPKIYRSLEQIYGTKANGLWLPKDRKKIIEDFYEALDHAKIG